MQMLCTINYVLNGEKLALQDVTIHEAEQTSLKEQLERQRSDMAFAANDGLQPMHEHNAFTQEQQLLRQVKSIFVVTATLVSCAAIQGGLSPEDVFTLSDTYMQKCELPPALERITNLQYHMVLEFTERVERLRFGGKPTVHEPPLPVHPVQKGERRDPDGLHPQRKNGGGQTPLRYSDKSLSAIGACLGFSSPGHFAQVFRKYARMTPTEYRDRNAR